MNRPLLLSLCALAIIALFVVFSSGVIAPSSLPIADQTGAVEGVQRVKPGAAQSEPSLPPSPAPLAVAPDHTERTVMGWELGQALNWALDRLSPEHRAVIELTFGEERSYQEIAGIVGCPVNTVKTRMFHARKKLAHLLAQCGHGEFAVASESLP